MPKASLDILPEAVQEAQAAYLWYSAQTEAAGDGFMEELDHALEQVTEHPGTWPRYLHSTQRYVLRRYPFFVVYRHRGDVVLVVPIAHAKRKPGYWKNR